MANKQFIGPANRAFTSNGFPAPGATLSLYLSGTLTPANFYADDALTTSLGPTLTANGAGRFEDEAYQDEFTAFRVIYRDALGVQLDDIDPFFFGYEGPRGPQGIAGDVAKVATIADLAATPVGGQASGLTRYVYQDGRHGIFIWSTDDLSTFVAADTEQGIYIAPAAGLGVATDGSAGAWVRQFDGPVYLEWFGIVSGDPSASAANSTARDAMLATLQLRAYNPLTIYYGLEPIKCGAAEYHFSSAWDLRFGTVSIEGTGSGIPNAIGTEFHFDAGTDGIIVQYYNTTGDSGGAGAEHSFGQGSLIRGIIFKGAYDTAGAEGEYHGAVIRCPAKFEDCQFTNFQGDGIYAHAGALSGTNLGVANLFRLINCTSNSNRNGISIAGSDVNVYTVMGGSYHENRQCGILEPDDASLGGLIIGAHFDGNGITTFGPPTVVSYSGSYYGVFYGQETWCSTNAPSGTTADNQGWYYISGGSPSTDKPAWSSGTTYRAGGPAICVSVNSATQFIACYSEQGAQGRPQVKSPAWILGGGMAGNVNKANPPGASIAMNGGALECSVSIRTDGEFIIDGVAVVTGQQPAMSGVFADATTGSLPTPNGSVTIADAGSPTNAELLEFCMENRELQLQVLQALRNFGLLAT